MESESDDDSDDDSDDEFSTDPHSTHNMDLSSATKQLDNALYLDQKNNTTDHTDEFSHCLALEIDILRNKITTQEALVSELMEVQVHRYICNCISNTSLLVLIYNVFSGCFIESLTTNKHSI